MLYSTVLAFLVLIATIYKCGAAHHYYVTATNGSDCPLTFPCHPLNYYVQNPDSYFTSNTVVEFLPGLHVFNYAGHVIISYARNLTLIGSDSHVNTSTRCSHSDSIVFCTNYSGFLFVGIKGLNMIKLHFTHCGAALPFPELQSSFLVALAVFHMRNLVISRVTIEKSYGYGLHVNNVWNKSVITDSCFISNNEYVYQRCIDPEYPSSCAGGNLYIAYNDFVLLDTPVSSSSSLDINNSEFWRGVGALASEQLLGSAGGVSIRVAVVNHDLHITINNSVIAENSGFVAGNMDVNIMFGIQHVTIRLDRCYIQSGNVTAAWFSWVSVVTGLTCLIIPVNEHFNRNITSVHISNTKFISNYGMDYFPTSKQFGSSERPNDCCIHNHDNHHHHFHSHNILPYLDCYQNITNCQETHQETS